MSRAARWTAAPTGWHAYRAIIAALPRILAADGAAVLELGVGQAPYLCVVVQAGFAAQFRPDLGGMSAPLT